MSDVPSSISLLHSLHKIVSYSEMSIVQNSKFSSSSTSSSIYPKRLAVFDFDHTITNDNTDTVVRSLLNSTLIHPQIEQIADTHGWTQYMQEIFKLLNQNRIKSDLILKSIREIDEVPGMVKCLKTLNKSYNFDLIIISDSNTEFINEWISSHGLSNIFSKIYTNPAEFNDRTNLLEIRPYHHQTECKLSAINLCKGKILLDYINEVENEQNLFYENIFYIGDGSNDLCPILKLRKMDYACPRKDYSLEKRIKKNNYATKIMAQIIIWTNGFDLLEKILHHIQ